MARKRSMKLEIYFKYYDYFIIGALRVKCQFLNGMSDIFEILWVYVTFDVDYEYAKKIGKKVFLTIFTNFWTLILS